MTTQALRYYLVARALRPDNYIVNVELGQQYINAEEFARAEKIFRDMIAKRPADPILAGELAVVFWSSGRAKEAEAQFLGALRLDENSLWVLRMYGSFLARQQRWDDAERLCRRVLELNDRVADAYALMAAIHGGRNEHAKALACSQRAAALNPADLNSRLSVAWALVRLGRSDEAAQASRDAVADFPGSLTAYSSAARVFGSLGQPEEGLEWADRGLELAAAAPNPRKAILATLHALRGGFLGIQGNVDEGVEAYRQAIAATPDSVEPYLNLGHFLTAHQRYEEACEVLDRALQIEPNNVQLLTQMANALQRLAKIAESVPYLERALKFAPNEYMTLALLADAHLGTNQPAEALAVARRLVASAPDNPQCYWCLAITLRANGEYDEALEAVQRAAASIGQPYLLGFVGDTCVMMDKPKEAIAAFTQVLEIVPQDLGTHAKIVGVWHAQGDPERALAAAEAAVSAVPNAGYGHYLVGRALARLRRYDEAMLALQRALARDPNEVMVRALIADLNASIGKVDEALQELRRISAEQPTAGTYGQLAWALATYPGASKRDSKEAMALMSNAQQMVPQRSHKFMGAAFFRAGRHAEAEAEFAKALDDGTDQHACGAFMRAMNLHALGRKEQAAHWLKEARRRTAMEKEYPWADHVWLAAEAKKVFGE
jgi:tetratricopeptide (TPR) repeat protein